MTAVIFAPRIACCDSPDSCKGPLKPFERESTAEQENPAQCRHVSDEVRALLKGALSELESSMSQGYGRSAFGSASSHGFLKELISDVVAHCHKLFSVEDIIVNVPVFSRRHAVATLGISNEVFDDITENNFLGFTDANNDYVNSEFDNLLERCYQDFVEDFIRPLFNLY